MLRQFQNRKDYSQSVNLGREKFLCVLTLHFKSSRKKALAHLEISWELVTQRYARHLRFIFGISAIYLEAAHKQNSSCSGQPLHHTRNTSACFCFSCRRERQIWSSYTFIASSLQLSTRPF